jgi:hypothetical protein
MKSKDQYEQIKREIKLTGKLRGLKGKALDQAGKALSPDEVKLLVNRAQRLRGKKR